MILRCTQSHLTGSVEIPGSKSHTIRAIAIAALAEGESLIREPLDSGDTQSACKTYAALGAVIHQEPGLWRVQGTGGNLRPPAETIDVGNSGTTLRIAMGSCALLQEGAAILTGDDQIQARPAGPLAQSLTDLGAQVTSQRGNGCAPFEVIGPLSGGQTTIEAVTSQYLTSLLMCAPLADTDSTINVPLLNERPYVEITLDWLQRQGITVEHNDDLSEFHIPPFQTYTPVDRRIPADFSSGTFFLCAAALGDNDITCRGLDYSDTQGDKAVVDYLREMGADVTVNKEDIHVKANALQGCELDLNATPDALPMMAVLGCFAQGETRLVNVPQARMKETDRIAVMHQELTKLGADVEELPDGLIIRESTLHGTTVDGHSDHRVVMALAIAATRIPEQTTILGAEAASITYPGFLEALKSIGGNVTLEENEATAVKGQAS